MERSHSTNDPIHPCSPRVNSARVGVQHRVRSGDSGRPTQYRALLPALLLLIPLGAPTAIAQTSPQSEKIDEILTRLQKRSDGLTDIRANVRFIEDDQINLTKRIKQGDILFLITQPNPHFLIHFEKTEVDGLLGKQEWYLFDGRWFHQALERIQQVTKQEVARADEKKNLFDLEKAPFPLPFGQKKETILRNFDVTLKPRAESDPPNTDHLVCIPKPGSTMHGQYDKLEFFVLQGVDLPARIVVTKNDGYETNTADFPDLSNRSINTGVSTKDFAIPKAWRKYKEVIERLPPESAKTP